MTIKLDYSLTEPSDRVALVEQIVAETPSSQLTHRYQEILANYIIFAADKKERKERKILTEGRMVTVNKRETSYEALVDKLENGEDGIWNLMREDKNTLLSPKNPISQKDIEDIPHLKTLVDAIERVEPQAKAAIGHGKKAYLLKKQVIQMRQDQYVIRNGAKEPQKATSLIKSIARMELPEYIYMDAAGDVHAIGTLNLYTKDHVEALLTHYSQLKEEIWDDLDLDMHYLLMDLENVATNALYDKHPMLYELMVWKIDGKTNLEIQAHLEAEFGVKHSPEYISSLWRNKIPKLIAEQAGDEWLIWHFSHEEQGHWKKCSKCGETKLAHNRFFSKNKTSKDGFYSVCKKCRNKKVN